MHRSRVGVRPGCGAAGVLVVLCGASTCLAQATFSGLGVHPEAANTGWYPRSSHDGRSAAVSMVVAGVARAARWTVTDGAVLIDSPCAAALSGDVLGISSNGRHVVGRVPDATQESGPAYVWSAAGGRVDLGDLPGGPFDAFAEGVSDDGRVVVGVGNYAFPVWDAEAFRWTPEGGFQGLGFLRPTYNYSDAIAVSADGSKIIGWSGRGGVEFRGFVWTEAGGMQELEAPAQRDVWHSPWGMNRDGTFIAGNADLLDGRLIQVLWDSAGKIHTLGNAPGGVPNGAAIAVTDNGGMAVGFDHYVFDEVTQTESMIATVWRPGFGVQHLKEVLESEHGLDLTGWTLSIASGISGDGSVIFGVGVNPDGLPEYWRVTLPGGGCKADLNGDGLVDFADYLEFLNRYDAGC